MRWVPAERGKDLEAARELPAAELEDSLDLPHGLQGPFATAGLAGPGCLAQKRLPVPLAATDQVLG